MRVMMGTGTFAEPTLELLLTRRAGRWPGHARARVGANGSTRQVGKG